MGIIIKWFRKLWHRWFGFKPGTMIVSHTRHYLMWQNPGNNRDHDWIQPHSPVMFLGYGKDGFWRILGPTRPGLLMLWEGEKHEFEVWHDF